MRKTIKKLAALFLAGALTAGMAVMPAMADSTAKHTITVNNINGDEEKHSYEAYQVFAGDYSKDSQTNAETLSNVTWGAGVKGDDLLAALKNHSTLGSTFASCATAEDVAEAMSTLKKDPDQMKALAKVIAKNLSTTKAARGESPLQVTGDGYYFVQDVTENLTEATKTNYIMNVVGNVTVTAKADVPTVVKKVQDVNDSTGETSEWQDSADYDIGDSIPYQITGTLPDNYDTYDTYQYIFTDKMSKGLTYNKDAEIKAGDQDLTTSFTEVISEPDEDGYVTVTWTCKDLKAIEGVTLTADSSIVVTYTCTLNSNAALGKEGNPNTVTLKYSNNPNNGGEGTSETPIDKNIVFTYKVNVDKFNENKEKLTGADFTLYKEVSKDTDGAQTGEAIKAGFGESVKADALADAKYYVVMETKSVDSTGSTFGFSHIDDGTYVLVETTIPEGYNAWDAQEVVVEATHDAKADEPALTKLTGGDLLTGDVNTGILDTDIENQKGSTLPSTGGMGTTIFYIIGGILVAAAVIVLVAKKKVQQ